MFHSSPSSRGTPSQGQNPGVTPSSKTKVIQFTDKPEVDMRDQVIKRCLEWSPPIDYFDIKSLMLPEVVSDKSQWLLFGRRFEAYLRSHLFAHKFWKLERYLLPAYIVLNDGKKMCPQIGVWLMSLWMP